MHDVLYNAAQLCCDLIKSSLLIDTITCYQWFELWCLEPSVFLWCPISRTALLQHCVKDVNTVTNMSQRDSGRSPTSLAMPC